jgi:hypothetical protein
VSRIFPENRGSLILHERAGFRMVGVYRRHGRLAGDWRDCVIVERLLGGPPGTDPSRHPGGAMPRARPGVSCLGRRALFQ